MNSPPASTTRPGMNSLSNFLAKLSTRPPMRSRASSTVTSYPAALSSYAQLSPASPAPITTTRFPPSARARRAMPSVMLESMSAAPAATLARSISRRVNSSGFGP